MNKAQKEVQQAFLDNEKAILRELSEIYEQAQKDVEAKIFELYDRKDMENLPSIIYQLDWQKAIKKQIDSVLDNLNSKQFASIADYLTQCYEDGYIGTMYDLYGQKIPLAIACDPKAVIRAVKLDSKIKGSMYTHLGENVAALKDSIRKEISRGISTGISWAQIARNISRNMIGSYDNPKGSYAYAMRIARTEGHRIQIQSTMDAQQKAQDAGADIVKQWDATLDGRTRPTHQILDGQIRELDEDFEVNGKKVSAPGMFGTPSEDCNCRCALLQRAKWALDQEELDVLKERAEYFGLDKAKNFDEFKQKYLKVTKNADTMKLNNRYNLSDYTQKLKVAMNSKDYEEYIKLLEKNKNESIWNIYSKYADKIKAVSYSKNKGYYSPSENRLVFSYPLQKYIDAGRSKYHILAHEYGHYFDAKAKYDGLNFVELETIYSKTKYQMNRFQKVASSSDEFLTAAREDREYLRVILTKEIEEDLRSHHASSGVQDAIDGLLGHRINWGHGDRYYNRKYSSVKSLKEHKGLQAAYKELGIDASNQRKTARECRIYEAASEIWANIMSAEINGGQELEYVKKYLPNSYEALIKILKGVK